MIVDAYAIIHPRTMVVKSFDATIADCTVSAATGSYTLTVWTQLRIFYCKNHSHEIV